MFLFIENNLYQVANILRQLLYRNTDFLVYMEFSTLIKIEYNLENRNEWIFIPTYWFLC